MAVANRRIRKFALSDMEAFGRQRQTPGYWIRYKILDKQCAARAEQVTS